MRGPDRQQADLPGRRERPPPPHLRRTPRRLEAPGAEGHLEEAFAYIAGGAGTGRTMRANRDGLRRVADRAADAARREASATRAWSCSATRLGVAVRAPRRSECWRWSTRRPTWAVARAARPDRYSDDILEPGLAADGGVRPRWARGRASSSSTGAPPTSSSRASWAGRRPADARPSSSRWTPRSSAGAAATGGCTSRSCAEKRSPSTRDDPVFTRLISRGSHLAKPKRAPNRNPRRPRCGRWWGFTRAYPGSLRPRAVARGGRAPPCRAFVAHLHRDP